MEDVSPATDYLVDYIKEWLDRAPFKGQIKNASAYPDYGWFIITSQYTPEECFKEKDAVAIRRRSRFITFE